jgi:hypothetical protein
VWPELVRWEAAWSLLALCHYYLIQPRPTCLLTDNSSAWFVNRRWGRGPTREEPPAVDGGCLCRRTFRRSPSRSGRDLRSGSVPLPTYYVGIFIKIILKTYFQIFFEGQSHLSLWGAGRRARGRCF